MATQTLPVSENTVTDQKPQELGKNTEFQTGQVLPIVAAHFMHDIYTASFPPLLPALIEKFSLSLTQAGWLSAIMQLPALLNPLIGYMADRVSLRYFVILAPAVTATMISGLSLAPNYFALAVLLFCAGASTAAFHAPAPAMIGRVSGRKLGLGMSLFMVGGELAATLGPLLAVWAVSTWTLDGFWRIVVLGWSASLVLYWRLRHVSARGEKPGSLRAIIPSLAGLYLPIALINLFRNPMMESISTFLPTYMSSQGASLVAAGVSFSIVQSAGIAGVLVSGYVSDRLGRKPVLIGAALISVVMALTFLRVEGWLVVPALLALGFFSLSSTPILLAMVQEQFPNNRAVANGIFMMLTFVLRPLGSLTVGVLGDHLGLQAAYFWSALISLLMIPAILALPDKKTI